MKARILGLLLLLLLGAPAIAQADPAPNDDIENATAPTYLPYWDEIYAADASLQPGEPTGCMDSPSPGYHSASVWYRFEPTQTVNVGFVARLWENYVFTWTWGDASLGLFESTPDGPRLISCGARPSRDGRGTTMQHVAQAGKTYLIQVACRCLPRPFTQLEFGINAVPRNDLIESATDIVTLPFEDHVDMNWATISPDEPSACPGYLPGAPISSTLNSSVWYSITPATDVTLVAEARRNHGGPQIAIYHDAPSGRQAIGCWTPGSIPEPESPSPNTDWTLARFEAGAGKRYLIQVLQDDNDIDLDIPSDFELIQASSGDAAITALRAQPGPGRADLEFDHHGAARFRWTITACPEGGFGACRTVAAGFQRTATGTVRVSPLIGACVGDFVFTVTATDEIFNTDPNTNNDTASTSASFTPPLSGVGAGTCGLSD